MQFLKFFNVFPCYDVRTEMPSYWPTLLPAMIRLGGWLFTRQGRDSKDFKENDREQFWPKFASWQGKTL
jgi:hypothetical protein